jgi:hypothetical protein
VEIGGLFTTTAGDQSRFERYRDTRDGLFSSFSVIRQGDPICSTPTPRTSDTGISAIRPASSAGQEHHIV